MSYVPELVELSAAGLTVSFDGGDGINPEDDVLLIAEDGVEGWYDSPDDKTVMSERGQGDGAHDVWQSDFLYSARVITLHFVVSAHDRIGIVRLLNDVRRVCAHRRVKFRLKDALHDCYVTGRASWKSNGEYGKDGWLEDNTLTVTCERPEILSSIESACQLEPLKASMVGGGLRYGDTLASPTGLQYPLAYGLKVDRNVSNVAIMYNGGTSRAYPTFEVVGPMPDGVRLDFPGTGQSIVCSQPVYGVPLVLDCRSRTATMGGLDVSRTLSGRGFPQIPPLGSLNVVLSSFGSGFVNCRVRDTFM